MYKRQTGFGRRKPWILVGLPIAVVGFILLPFAQTALAIAAFILITKDVYKRQVYRLLFTAYHPIVPGSPLNGPTMSAVIQPP